MKLPSNNKRGITLVEVIVGVFVLSIFAVGILSLLIYNNQAVADSARDKVDYSSATQKLDMILAAVSNGDEAFVTYAGEGDNKYATGLEKEELADLIGILPENIGVREDRVDKNNPNSTIRGWYIELEFSEDLTVKGYAANTLGAFDK